MSPAQKHVIKHRITEKIRSGVKRLQKEMT